MGVAQCELLLDVVEHHAHAQRFRQYGQLGTDVAVSDDAQRLAAHLMRTGGRLVP